MLGGFVRGSLDWLQDLLRRARTPDLAPIAADIKAIVVAGNRAGLYAGTDVSGRAFAPLADATYRRGRGGLGPPTIPRHSASGLIARFEVRIAMHGPNELVIHASWPGVTHVKYLAEGTRHMPRRDPVGIRPVDRALIERKARDQVLSFIGHF